MINIADKIWAVKAVGRGGLAYMCAYNVKRDGTPDSATTKMMTTGQNWADVPARYSYVRDANGDLTKDDKGQYITELLEAENAGDAAIYDNVPMKGFKVGQDATRWTTENKVFRLHDPRGFTVEIPTGNLSTLIQSCTIINGEIMDECVWGREGCHILLPINAPEYKQVVKEIEKVDESLRLKDLKPGDYVKLHQHGSEGSERQFVGMVKLEWTQHRMLFDRVVDRSRGGYTYYTHYKAVNYRDDGKEVIRDTQWVGLFASTVQEESYNRGTHHGGQVKWEYSEPVLAVTFENATVKITSRRPGESPEEFKDLDAMLKRTSYYYAPGRRDCPDRVVKKFEKQDQTHYSSSREPAKDATQAHFTATVYQEAKYD